MGINKFNRGPNVITQREHLDAAGSRKIAGPILIPGAVVTDNTSAAPVLVREGNICRIRVSATTYVAFGDDSLGVVDATSSPALELGAGTHLVAATDDYIRTSAAVLRLEIIDG